MSDYQDNYSSREATCSKLYVCLFSTQQQLSNSITELIDSDRFELKHLYQRERLSDFVIQNSQQIDCLILSNDTKLDSAIDRLWQSGILLPTIIVDVEVEQLIDTSIKTSSKNDNLVVETLSETIYHQAELRLYPTQLKELNSYINLAISKFISLGPGTKISQDSTQIGKSLLAQQRRLTEKLKERLGYLGIYHQRDSNSFYRNLSPEQQQRLNARISQNYRQILLDYFDDDSQINKMIDEFVDQAFFADISTSQIVEIHMELIDEFAHQLKIEGRNEDILLDYRLPLIDVISHLCEMYRRSTPEKNISLEMLFTVE